MRLLNLIDRELRAYRKTGRRSISRTPHVRWIKSGAISIMTKATRRLGSGLNRAAVTEPLFCWAA